MSDLYPWLVPLYQKLWSQKSWPPALLVYGTSDFGQGLLVERLAHALLCNATSSEGEPCGLCPSCQWVAGGYHPDLHVLGIAEAGSTTNQELMKEEKKSVSVDDVRIIQESLSLTSHCQGLRIVVIPALEHLTLASQNALLKSLEEPAVGIIYLMATSELRLVTMTIRSRAIHERIAPSEKEGQDWLAAQGIENASLLWALSGHSPLSAKNLVEHNAIRSTWMQALTKSSCYQAQVGELIQAIDSSLWVDWLHRWVFDLIEQKLLGSIRFHLDFSDSAVKLAPTVNMFDLLAYEKYCRQTKRFLRHPLNTRLLGEATLISYYQLF